MRIKVSIVWEKNEVLVPYDHQYFLASYLYDVLRKIDPSFSENLHSSLKYKPYTFSYLLHQNYEKDKDGIIVKRNSFFFLSSPHEEFMKKIVLSLLKASSFRLSKLEGKISEIKIMKEREIKPIMHFRTLSPIIIKKYENNSDKKGWKNLYPNDPEYNEYLVKNLLRKYSFFVGKNDVTKKHLNIKFLNFKTKRHNIAGTYHRGVLADMIIEGDTELIKFAYDAGFGEKNAMGFGMVKVV